MKYIQYKQHIAVKYVISLALICPRSISTLTALPSGYSATAYGSFLYSHIFIYVVLSFLWNYDYLMSFVFWALTEVARELCLYKFQNALIAGPAQWDMRDDNTWLVWNALSGVYWSLTEYFGVAPARRPGGIKHIKGMWCHCYENFSKRDFSNERLTLGNCANQYTSIDRIEKRHILVYTGIHKNL